MPRGLKFRHRIGLLVLLAAAGLVGVTTVTLVLGRRSGRQMAGIETRYVPLLEVDRDLKATFAQIVRALEDAASSADDTRIKDADALVDAFTSRLAAGHDAIADNGGDTAALAAELRHYYAGAREVAVAISSGTPAAELGAQVVAMRQAQQAFTAHLDAATSPDRRRLAAAFETARASHDASLWIDIATAAAVLALMAFLSWRMIRRTVRTLGEVSAGVERLAGGEFDREIAVGDDDDDELGDLARQANQTAARLREYRELSDRDAWVKTRAVELAVAIAGEIDPAELGAKAIAKISAFTGADAGVLLRAGDDGPPRWDGGAPAHVVTAPITYQDRAMGRIALGFAAAPGERVDAFLARAGDILGVALHVASTYRTLENAKLAADAANRELEAFSYSVSHDLRSPLRAIDGFSQAVLDRNSAQLDAKGADYLRRVRAAAQRMGELIDALLQLAHINRVSLSRQRIDVSDLARGLADEIARRAPERTVSFAIADGLTADADGRLVRAVLDNLIGNAWKFTGKCEAARIEVGCDDGAFFVRDNGAGFDMAYGAKLFAPFQRLHTEAEFSGTGIGLATVRRIVDRHGGRVWAEGEVGRGATIYFTLAPPRGPA